jgi:hypothetical protein
MNQNRHLYSSWILFIGIVIALTLFNPVTVIVASYFGVWLFALLTRQRGLCVRLVIGIVIAIIWMLIAKGQYGYADHSVAVYGITIFPLFAIPSALVGFYLIYETVTLWVKPVTMRSDWLLIIVLDVLLVTAMEFIGYHIFQIQNLATSQYPGFAWCDCFHAPWWMQLSYYGFPIIFFAVYQVLEKRYLRK